MKVIYSSVKIILRKDKVKKDKTCPLYLSVIFSGNQFRTPLGISLLPKNWDNENNCPKGKNMASLKTTLDNKITSVKNYLNKLDIEGVTITKQLLKSYFRGENSKDFYDCYDDFCKKKFDTIREGTQYHYKLLRKQLKEYKSSLELKEVNYSFLNDFFYYLKHEKKIGETGLAMRRKNLVSTFEEFIKLEMINTNPAKKLPRYKEGKREVYLTKEEVQKLIVTDLDFGNKSYGLNLTRDLYLFSCYTGLRYGDVVNLTNKSISDDKIILEMEKTNKIVEVPLKKEAINILKKYNYKRKEIKIFPFRCNVSVNRDLKLIARLAKIKKILTFHSSRHTFGSILAENRVQPFYIMKLMGHADVRMTSRYVNSDSDILNNVMTEISFS